MSSYHETENLILEIKKRSIIWDSTSEEYKNKILKHDAWIDVCVAVRQDYIDASDTLKKQILSELQSRWKCIRDANKRSQKKRHGQSECGTRGSKKYVFADLLTFLQKTSPKIETADSLELETHYYSQSQNERLTQDTQEDEEQEMEPVSLSPIASTPSSFMQQNNARKRSRKTNIEERMIAFMDRCDGTDADKDFFNSLLPFVWSLTEDQKLEFRSQVLSLLQRIKSNGYVAPPNS